MDALFAEYTSTPGWVPWAMLALFTATIVAGFLIIFRNYKRKQGLVALATVLVSSLICSAALLTWQLSVEAGNNKLGDAAYQAREAWVESHGVNLTKSTMSDLEFPSISEKPENDENYGLAQVTNADREVITVTLAWEDGEFVLYGTDGQPLERMAD